MSWDIWQKLKTLTWTRDKSGNHTYQFTNGVGWADYDNMSNLQIAQVHPILTPAMLFDAKLFSQAELTVSAKDSKKEKKNHWLTKLLAKPNAYQTQNDFLESLRFIQVAQGKAVVYLKKPIGFNEAEDIESMYILDSDKIKWPEGYTSPMLTHQDSTSIQEQEITYDPNGENIKIKVKDLLFFYDLPNCLSSTGLGINTGGTKSSDRNFYETKSRLDGLRQTLVNTHDSLVAKNIILKTNGKEILSTGSTDNFPLAGEDKKQAESLLQNDYGLGWNRKRGIVTKANVTYQSMHIALRDLGLDESVKVDGNIIYTAMHIPKDIISLEAKKTTYNNFKESMVSYVQNEQQANLNSFLEVFQTLLYDTNLEVNGTYEHLPIMQFILIERYEGISKKAKALNDLLITGIPQETALEMCGFDRTTELGAIQTIVPGTTINYNIDGSQASEEEVKNLKII